MISRLLLAFVCATAAAFGAQSSQLNIDALHSESRIEGGKSITFIKGNATVRGEDYLLAADEIRYEQASESLTATGRVVFTRGQSRLLADRLVYRRTDGSFIADNIRLGSPPYFAEGASAEGNPREISIRRARVSYGEPGPWQPTLTADLAVIAPGRRLRTEGAAAGVGGLLPLRLPSFHHDLAQPLDARVSLAGGVRRSLGAFIDAEALVPVRPGLALGADLGLFTRRGVMVGPAAAYAADADGQRLRGHLRSGYISDHGDRKTDLLGAPIPHDRAFLDWWHQQDLSPSLSLNGRLSWWRDSEVVRDFRPREFFPVQEPDSFLEATHAGENYLLSAFARLQPNRFHRVQERLPELRLDLLPLPIGEGFLGRGHASAAMLREDPPEGGPSLRGTRFDAYYSFIRPIPLTDWLAFTPVAGGRLTHYTDSRGVPASRDRTYTRALGELGFDAALRSSGTFDYRNPAWKIDGLRHLLTPRLSYRHIPSAERGRARIPRIDRETFATYLPTLGLGDIRHIDDLHDTDTLRLGLDNILQTRDPAEGSRDLVFLNLAADLRRHPRPGQRHFSEIHSELALLPARWLRLDVYQSVAPQTGRLREFNSGLTLRDGSAWSLRFSNNFLRDQIRDYQLDARARLNERFEALTRLHYDARRRRFNEQTYGLAHNLNNTWLLSYNVSLYSGRRRESSFGFNVRVDAIGF